MSDHLDEIRIRGLEVWCHVGVPDEELAVPQRLLVDVILCPKVGFDSLGDDISATVDYDAVCHRLMALASSKPRRLIETLAADMAHAVLKEFAVVSVTIEIRKFILEQTEFVGVRCTRTLG
jgi:dihydroneopterin aldolase